MKDWEDWWKVETMERMQRHLGTVCHAPVRSSRAIQTRLLPPSTVVEITVDILFVSVGD
jgi:hypothetical protein